MELVLLHGEDEDKEALGVFLDIIGLGRVNDLYASNPD
jgi:hypothetical protein